MKFLYGLFIFISKLHQLTKSSAQRPSLPDGRRP